MRYAHLPTALTIAIMTASPAAARLYDRTPPRLELGLMTEFLLADSDDAFSELQPGILFAFRAGVHALPDVRAGVVLRAAVTDPHAELYELMADLTWSWVAEPRLPDPPTVRAAVTLELGWRMSELVGSDFVVDDNGFVASLAAEVGLVVFEDVSLSLRLAAITGSSSNTVYDDWAPKLRFGVCLATLL